MSKVVSIRSSVQEFASTLLRRINLANQAGKTFNGNRDLFAILGYKRVLGFNDFLDRYDRGDIAARIVDAMAVATWRNPPVVKAKGKHPAFAAAWEKLEKKHSIYHYLERTDRISGIGNYGILLMGFSGGNSVDKQVKRGAELLYLSPYHQGNAPILTIQQDPTNERFGLPQSYKVNIGTVLNLQSTQNIDVHWSRVLHLAEGLNEDEILGSPRMMKIWNRLDDLDKVVGGSSEAVWRTVDRGIQFDVDKDMELLAEDEAALTEEIEEYIHNLKRYVRTKGIKANPLGGEVPDPTGVVNVLISLISGTTGIPKRILLGSELGQLASSQDERNFVSRIKERQDNYAGPKILRPFVERLVEVGVLPEPRGGVEFEWPDLSIVSMKEKADVAARIAQAIANVGKHTQNGGIPLISAEEFRRLYMGIVEPLDTTDLVRPAKAPIVKPPMEDE